AGAPAPPPHLPRLPFWRALSAPPAPSAALGFSRRFRSERTRALFAGLAAHSFLALDEILSGAFGLLMAIPAHAVGWPIARGGSQSLTNALVGYLERLGGRLKTSCRIEKMDSLFAYDVILCDVTPRQLLRIAGSHFTRPYA